MCSIEKDKSFYEEPLFDTIIIEGVQYKFVENTQDYSCAHCALVDKASCYKSRCFDVDRTDKKSGYFIKEGNS